jgi:hypothetical protein
MTTCAHCGDEGGMCLRPIVQRFGLTFCCYVCANLYEVDSARDCGSFTS